MFHPLTMLECVLNIWTAMLARSHTHTEFFMFMTYSDCSVKQSEIKYLIQQQPGKASIQASQWGRTATD